MTEDGLSGIPSVSVFCLATKGQPVKRGKVYSLANIELQAETLD